jgi:hypothetical protein
VQALQLAMPQQGMPTQGMPPQEFPPQGGPQQGVPLQGPIPVVNLIPLTGVTKYIRLFLAIDNDLYKTLGSDAESKIKTYASCISSVIGDDFQIKGDKIKFVVTKVWFSGVSQSVTRPPTSKEYLNGWTPNLQKSATRITISCFIR